MKKHPWRLWCSGFRDWQSKLEQEVREFLEAQKEKWIPGDSTNLQDMLKAVMFFSRRKGY